MGLSGGYVFIFDDGSRNSLLYNLAESNTYFTDTFSANMLDLRGRRPSMCFLSFDKKEISHAALVRRSNTPVTAKYAVRFYDFVRLSPSVPLDLVRQHIGISFSLPIHGVSTENWSALLTLMKDIRPDSALDLSRLETLVSSSTDFSDDFDTLRAIEEKDALGLALKIFGGNFSQELSQMTAPTQHAPFLQGLVHALITEDSMINHDSSVFGDGWREQGKYQVDAAQFVNEQGELLTIMNVNRKNVEKALGVDLIYYNHSFQSYVMVQYKRMLKESKEFVYRPDKQCIKEIIRMKQFEEKNLEEVQKFKMEEYRLNAGIFFLKLCPSVTFEPFSDELIKGMYLPLEYWDILEESPELKSKQEGIKFTFKNVSRHINNTLFIQLVQSGWIGSRLKKTETLSTLIKQLLEDGRSVLLASSSEKPDSNNGSVLEDNPLFQAPLF